MTKKELRRQQIMESARQLFITNGIDETPFADIAAKADVGEATVYRHFENKSTLAMAIAMTYVDTFATEIIKEIRELKCSDLDKFAFVLDYYIDMFRNKPDYFIYLEHFDNFVVKLSDKPIGFEAYEARFDDIEKAICDLDKGETLDNSIRPMDNTKLTFYTFNITFVSLCQKLLLRGRITHGDVVFDKIDELKLMKDVFMNHLK